MMKKEIGSEFWTGCSHVGILGCKWNPPQGWSTRETMSGRVALEYLVERLVEEGRTSVYMPSYCCHTMVEPFLKHGVRVVFYDVLPTESGLKRVFDHDHGCDIVFLLDYFGFTDDETAKIASIQQARGKQIIYDATHSLYSGFKYDDCDYVFGSYRKWMDVNIAFVAVKGETEIHFGDDWKQLDAYIDIRTRLFDLKSRYMNDEDVDKKLFLTWINEAEELLEQEYHHTLPDQRSIDVLEQTDCTFLVQSRRDNAKILMEGITDLKDERVRFLLNEMSAHDTPLFVPIYVQADLRDELRRCLIEHNIYCPVHWPLSELHKINDVATEVFQCELSLLCDQRYNDSDMYKIVETIKKYLNK